jgi:hypothetical protein
MIWASIMKRNIYALTRLRMWPGNLSLIEPVINPTWVIQRKASYLGSKDAKFSRSFLFSWLKLHPCMASKYHMGKWYVLL